MGHRNKSSLMDSQELLRSSVTRTLAAVAVCYNAYVLCQKNALSLKDILEIVAWNMIFFDAKNQLRY